MTKPESLELTRADQPNLELTKGGHLEVTRGGPSQLELTTHHMSRLEMQSLNLTRYCVVFAQFVHPVVWEGMG